jgi:hypothetical protein
MNHLQHKTPSDFTGITALMVSLAIVGIALSLIAPKEVSLDPMGRAHSPYAVLK